jgi:hypothetical protein
MLRSMAPSRPAMNSAAHSASATDETTAGMTELMAWQGPFGCAAPGAGVR